MIQSDLVYNKQNSSLFMNQVILGDVHMDVFFK